MNKLIVSIAIILMVLFFPACQQLKPERPEAETSLPPLQNELSRINFPVSYEVKRLEDLINKKLKGTVHEDLSYDNNGGDNLKLVVKRVGRIRLAAKNNVLSYNLPLNIWLQKKVLGKGKDGYNENKGMDFTVNLFLESSVAIGRSWKLYTETKLREVVWEKDPQLRISFIKVNVKGIVDNFLQKNSDLLTKQIDQAIGNGVNVKKSIQKVWTDIQKPILINKKVHKVWLKADPKEIGIGSIKTKGETLVIPLSISAFFTTMYGNSPNWKVNKKLPSLKLNSAAPTGFNMAVLAKIPHREVNLLLASKLKGKELSIEGNELIINRVEVFGGGKKLYVRVSIKGDVSGDIYFQGIPTFDTKKTAFFVDSFEFEVKTQEALLSMADWLMHDTLKEQIKEALYVSLEEEVKKLPELIYNGIEKGKSGKKFSLVVDRMDATVKDIIVTEGDIQVLLFANGKANLELEDL